jgi:hypothetical protein
LTFSKKTLSKAINKNATLSIMQSIVMLSYTFKPFMLNVIMLSVVMQIAMAPSILSETGLFIKIWACLALAKVLPKLPLNENNLKKIMLFVFAQVQSLNVFQEYKNPNSVFKYFKVYVFKSLFLLKEEFEVSWDSQIFLRTS